MLLLARPKNCSDIMSTVGKRKESCIVGFESIRLQCSATSKLLRGKKMATVHK